jgi:hypothetical protein
MKNYSAIAGLISAACFAVPAVRQELRRKEYARFLKYNKLAGDQKLSQAAESFMFKNFLRWDRLDSIFVFIGIGFLAASFLFEIFW